MAIVSEFMAAVNQICSERGIDPEEVFEALEAAVVAAYKKDYGGGDTLKAEINRDTGEIQIIADKEVVTEVTDDDSQISIKDALALEPNLQEGDHVEIEMKVEGFGRIAAQTAKQVILQKVRESEKEAVISEFEDRLNTVVTGLVQRMAGPTAVIEIGKAIAKMPPEEQIPNEFYRIGERYKFYLKEIKDGQDLVVSRGDPNFLIELFKLEVPEIESGVVEVKACAREAGSRSKMAVISHQDGIDPIGSCVGQKGVRIANIMTELGEEKIDIILWDESIDQFVANALGPAKVEDVKVEESVAKVTVSDDQLSLAIGKDGQNVRLAAKLTGLKIDITSPSLTAKVDSDLVADVEEDDSATIALGDVAVSKSAKKTSKKSVETNDGDKEAKKKSKKESSEKKATSKSKTSKKADKEAKVEKAELSKRILNSLDKAGLKPKALLDMKEEDLLAISGIGKAALAEIEEFKKSQGK